jgi:hypothetical protein
MCAIAAIIIYFKTSDMNNVFMAFTSYWVFYFVSKASSEELKYYTEKSNAQRNGQKHNSL